METRIKRRDTVFALLALGAAPLVSHAQQQGKIWRVGFLSQRARPDSLDADIFGAFPRGMRELGYVEGKNLVIEWRFANGNVERLPELVAELVRLKVDAIVTSSTPATRVLQKATTTIPIVMGTIGDPVGSGFVASLGRPGGNITGLTSITNDLSPKLLELLLGIVPQLSRVAVVVNSTNPFHASVLKNVQAAAQKTGITILSVEARTVQEIEIAFPTITKERAGAVILAQDSLFTQQRRQIAELSAKHRLPLIAAMLEYVEAGVLMSYGPSFADIYRRAATYVDKIFRGAKPGDLPIERPTKFDLAVNLKTARALGLTIPQSILIRADRVIE
jgi:putative ABC transport system substrate-binding protein